jgi:hypothetical protein
MEHARFTSHVAQLLFAARSYALQIQQLILTGCFALCPSLGILNKTTIFLLPLVDLPRGPGSIPGATRFSEKQVGLERGPLSLVSTTEELLDRKVAARV